jgi:GNAT superfamily N-acetyltransferase
MSISNEASHPDGTEIEVVRTYLQMTERGDFNGAPADDPQIRVEQIKECPASFYRYLYAEVGRLYHWVDRLPWTDEQIRAHLAREEVTLWLMHRNGAPAGYFELERHEDGSAEIAYFGLLQESIGKGLGKHLLTEAVERGWETGANRVWLHTCTLDDPAALPNYLRRGFKRFKEERYVTTVSAGELERGGWKKS